MTGPEHYAEAERLVAGATVGDGSPFVELVEAATVAAAQVHATLALAAAQALLPVAQFMGDDPQVTEWARAIGHQQAPAVPA